MSIGIGQDICERLAAALRDRKQAQEASMLYDSDEDIYLGLRAGAKGYLLKDAEPDELLVAIRTVQRS